MLHAKPEPDDTPLLPGEPVERVDTPAPSLPRALLPGAAAFSVALHLTTLLVLSWIGLTGAAQVPELPEVFQVALVTPKPAAPEAPPPLPEPAATPAPAPTPGPPAPQPGDGPDARKAGVAEGPKLARKVAARPGPPPGIGRTTGRAGMPMRDPRAAPTRTASGGGSPAPSPDLTGQDGVKAPEKPVEDVIYSGGGRGGAELPREAPRAGGGEGTAPAATQVAQATPAPRDPEAPSGGAPQPGAGTRPESAGAGFAAGGGIGTSPDQSKPERATEKAAENGPGIGAAPDPKAANTGTESPGGGKGTGSALPGTGGTGQGYGKGAGDAFGDGRDKTGNGEGDGRGALFGVGSGGNGGDGGGGGGGAAVHVAYVIDVSISMQDMNKFGTAKKALKQALQELKPGDSYTIIGFDESTYTFSRQLVPVTQSVRMIPAMMFIDSLQMGPGTNLSAGLRWALAIPGVNRVYVLSDGHPTVGITDDGELKRAVRRWNRGGVSISCVALGFGQAFEGTELLRSIARDSGGDYQFIDMRSLPGDLRP